MPNPLQRVRRILRRVGEDQLRDLLVNRHIFQQFEEATRQYVGTARSAVLGEWIGQCYVAFAGTGIRRAVEAPPSPPKAKACPKCGHVMPARKPKPESSISLVVLLEELKKHPSLLTRKRFRRLCRPVAERFADEWFDRIAGRHGATEVSATVIDRDVLRLKRQTKRVKRLVNKLIAHTEMDRRRIGRHRYGHLNSAINVLFDVYRKYYLLLQGKQPSFPVEDFDASEDFAKIWP